MITPFPLDYNSLISPKITLAIPENSAIIIIVQREKKVERKRQRKSL